MPRSISFTFDGDPVPAPRPRFAQGRTLGCGAAVFPVVRSAFASFHTASSTKPSPVAHCLRCATLRARDCSPPYWACAPPQKRTPTRAELGTLISPRLTSGDCKRGTTLSTCSILQPERSSTISCTRSTLDAAVPVIQQWLGAYYAVGYSLVYWRDKIHHKLKIWFSTLHPKFPDGGVKNLRVVFPHNACRRIKNGLENVIYVCALSRLASKRHPHTKGTIRIGFCSWLAKRLLDRPPKLLSIRRVSLIVVSVTTTSDPRAGARNAILVQPANSNEARLGYPGRTSKYVSHVPIIAQDDSQIVDMCSRKFLGCDEPRTEIRLEEAE